MDNSKISAHQKWLRQWHFQTFNPECGAQNRTLRKLPTACRDICSFGKWDWVHRQRTGNPGLDGGGGGRRFMHFKCSYIVSFFTYIYKEAKTQNCSLKKQQQEKKSHTQTHPAHTHTRNQLPSISSDFSFCSDLSFFKLYLYVGILRLWEKKT